jgi:uncharacterized repeat protein (TIGR03803 family)
VIAGLQQVYTRGSPHGPFRTEPFEGSSLLTLGADEIESWRLNLGVDMTSPVHTQSWLRGSVRSAAIVLVSTLVLPVLLTRVVLAQTFSTLYTFTGGTDGGTPLGRLVRDPAGNLYGTTDVGGEFGFGGFGVVFKLDQTGKETVLHNFGGTPNDGENPQAGLIPDSAGNGYGTTYGGGASGNGTVFRLARNGKETLYGFAGGNDGRFPESRVIFGPSGLYGTTVLGGSAGNGVVFKVDSAGRETTFHAFAGPPDDGANPYAGLVRDPRGNLYGTAYNGGTNDWGVVFKVDNAGKETILHNFAGVALGDGGNPYAGELVRDSAGNLYGTTQSGGTADFGTVFVLDSTGKETVLYSFQGGTDGSNVVSGVVRDPEGNLYGTTFQGGDSPCGCGTVFMLDTLRQETILYSFTGGADGGNPFGTLVRDAAGHLYGTTEFGGDPTCNCGVVFKVTPKIAPEIAPELWGRLSK